MRTTPEPSQLARNVDPAVREYVEAIVAQAQQRHAQKIDQVLRALQRLEERLVRAEAMADPRRNGTEALIKQFRKDFGDAKTLATKAAILRAARAAKLLE
jgi:hypothetical protein